MYKTFVMFLERELLSDECVKLEQAGHNVDDRIPLASVFVDLPTHDESAGLRAPILDDTNIDIGYSGPSGHPEEAFIKEILAASSELLDPTSIGTSVISNNLDPRVPRGSRGRFVLMGGPGQGKTTLTQFICQIFRASIDLPPIFVPPAMLVQQGQGVEQQAAQSPGPAAYSPASCEA